MRLREEVSHGGYGEQGGQEKTEDFHREHGEHRGRTQRRISVPHLLRRRTNVMIRTPSPTLPHERLPHWGAMANGASLPRRTSSGRHFQNVRKQGCFRTSWSLVELQSGYTTLMAYITVAVPLKVSGRTRGVFENNFQWKPHFSAIRHRLNDQCGSENTYSIPPFELFFGKSVTAFTKPFAAVGSRISRSPATTAPAQPPMPDNTAMYWRPSGPL